VTVRCLGCGKELPFDENDTICYTHSCGATVFYGENTTFLPVSLLSAIKMGTAMPHIDYYVGFSSFESPVKTKFIEGLKLHGATWSWECKECLKRNIPKLKFLLGSRAMKREDFHPDLLKALEEVNAEFPGVI
jgi:hypothetical protein